MLSHVSSYSYLLPSLPMIILKQIPDIILFHAYHHVSVKDKGIDDIKGLLLLVSDGIVVLCLCFIKKELSQC